MTFGQNIASCGLIATVNATGPGDVGPGSASVIAGVSGATSVFVRTVTPSGTGNATVDDDRPFTLAALC